MAFLRELFKDLLRDFAFWILLPIAMIVVGGGLFWLGEAVAVSIVTTAGAGLIGIGVAWLVLLWIMNTIN